MSEPGADTYALFQEGRRRLRDGMPAQATVPLERARSAEPGKASIREALGIAYFRLRRWHDAEEEFRAVLDVSPVDAYAHYALARCLDRQGHTAEANGHYKLAGVLELGAPGSLGAPGGPGVPGSHGGPDASGGPGLGDLPDERRN